MSRDSDKLGGARSAGGEPSAPDKRTQEMFRLEREAEEMSARLYAESQEGLENRCDACGALGSLEEQDDGAVRCVDCDVVVAQRSKLGGFGRK